MTIAVISPTAPARLGSAAEIVRFTSTRDLTALSIGFGPNHKEERVYRNGTFLPGYELSSVSALTWAIVRAEGFPPPPYDPPTFWFAEQSAAADYSVGDLQPTLYSPLALYALRGAPTTATTYADRSGNSRPLTAGAPIPCPDAIPGFTAVTRSRLTRGVDAGLNLIGAVTVNARVWYAASGGTQVIAAVGNAGGASNQNTAWLIGCVSDGTLYTYTEHGSAVGAFLGSTLALTPGKWSYVSLRRSSDGVSVSFGLDGVYQNATLGFAATDASASSLVIGEDPVSGSLAWLGGLSDVGIWGARLSSTQDLGQRKVMMGIP